MSDTVYNKNGISFDIDAIATDLNGKADVDLTNVNDSGTSRGAGWAMPSDTYEDLTLGASESSYTAPANGYLALCKVAGDTGKWIEIVNESNAMQDIQDGDTATQELTVNVPLLKGTIATVYYTATGTTKYFRFI